MRARPGTARGFTWRSCAALTRHDIDLVAMAGFFTILHPVIFERYAGRILNTHPALLPSFKGAHAVRDTLAPGSAVTGPTIHVATEVLDDERHILAQSARVPVLPGDDVDTLWERVKVEERRFYRRYSGRSSTAKSILKRSVRVSREAEERSMTLTTIEAPGLRLFRRGKVRDTFELPDGTLLMVASDRISAFDVVLPTAIPGKGAVLTQMSRWWFGQTAELVPNHLLDDPGAEVTDALDWPALRPRSMRVARAERIDVECVVRGYLAGSGWQEYRTDGTLAGEPLPRGLLSPRGCPSPGSPRRSRTTHGHDENISRAAAREPGRL